MPRTTLHRNTAKTSGDQILCMTNFSTKLEIIEHCRMIYLTGYSDKVNPSHKNFKI